MQQFSQVYYLTFMCGSTCFGRLHAHHQELTTALTASGFTVGALVVTAFLIVVSDHDQQHCYHQCSDGKIRGNHGNC
jgi:hypothetical protein